MEQQLNSDRTGCGGGSSIGSSGGDGYDSFRRQPTFKPIDNLYQDRLRQFTDNGGQFHTMNLTKFYVHKAHDVDSIKFWGVEDIWDRPLFKDIDFDHLDWSTAHIGQSFGPSWKTFWFKLTWQLPLDWHMDDANHPLELEWDSSSEALVYSCKGVPLQAFTGGERTIYKLPLEYYTTEKLFTLYMEMACNGMFGNGSGEHPDPNRWFRLNTCRIRQPNLNAFQLFWDFWILGDSSREFPGFSWQKYKANELCNRIMDTYDPNDVSSIDACRKLAQEMLGPDVDLPTVFNKGNIDPKNVVVHGVGNCHIDTAWLWPFAETKRKIVRSWTTQIKLTEEYPEYVFVASQMQQFKWLKIYHPEIFDKVKQKFTTNQFIPIGGSWVEHDTNMPNGESLIRQFVFGQRFLNDNFGFKSDVFWLPDTFGYSSQIPQVCQECGLTKFLTQKLSWNNINLFPLTTFNWVGIDGSQVLVHMPPANTYTASAHWGDVWRTATQNKNMRDSGHGLLLFGHGDGGGGPTGEMIEKIRRCRGLANTVGMMPPAQLGTTVEEFYDLILKSTDQGRTLPSWLGEIYLEFHRGTYTTQAKVKKFMRTGEIKLHDLEYLATIAHVTRPEFKYPHAEISSLWEDLLLCQFHDVLPGSCIGMVYYHEVHPLIDKFFSKVDKLTNDVLSYFGNKDKTTNFINTLPWDRQEIIDHPDFGVPRLVQFSANSSEVSIVNASLLKYPARLITSGGATDTETAAYVLTNDLLKVEINSNGLIQSIWDFRNGGREVLDSTKTSNSNGFGNQFLLFEDRPNTYPAWDTELYNVNTFKFLENGEVDILSVDPLLASIKVINKLDTNSHIETIISLNGTLDETQLCLHFKCKVINWNKTYEFLKVQFPTTIFTASEAKYETQFGITKRPTHYNTNWDIAKFEVCHHKFMDLSDYKYGVSILNNCKYGASIHGNLMRLSLLRSPKVPDDKADMGDHEFEYCLYPHLDDLGIDTVRKAWEFNYKVLQSEIPVSIPTLVYSKGDANIVLSHLKLPEAKSKSKVIIIRLYESLGGSGSKATIVVNDKYPISQVHKLNALEDVVKHEVAHDKSKNTFDIELRGFEIATYKVVFSG